MIETARMPARTEPWPLTREAFAALCLEIERLLADLAAAPSLPPADRDALEERDAAEAHTTSVPLPIDVARAQRRLESLSAIRQAAAVVEDPGVAAAGRRVTLASDDKAEGRGATGDPSTESYSLVLPGDGDPSLGWVSMTSPLGAALLGRRAGERVSIHAPAGSWSATILAVE